MSALRRGLDWVRRQPWILWVSLVPVVLVLIYGTNRLLAVVGIVFGGLFGYARRQRRITPTKSAVHDHVADATIPFEPDAALHDAVQAGDQAGAAAEQRARDDVDKPSRYRLRAPLDED